MFMGCCRGSGGVDQNDRPPVEARFAGVLHGIGVQIMPYLPVNLASHGLIAEILVRQLPAGRQDGGIGRLRSAGSDPAIAIEINPLSYFCAESPLRSRGRPVPRSIRSGPPRLRRAAHRCSLGSPGPATDLRRGPSIPDIHITQALPAIRQRQDMRGNGRNGRPTDTKQACPQKRLSLRRFLGFPRLQRAERTRRGPNSTTSNSSFSADSRQHP